MQLLLDNVPTVVETLPNVYLVWEALARDEARPFRDVRVYINSFDASHTRTIRTFLAARSRAIDPGTGKQVPRGQVGLIEIAQPGRCLAYVGEQHRHDLKRDGWWWNTGDLGVINRFGAVRLVDREIDRIPGASAIELEDVLLDRLPQTTEVVILAVDGMKPVPVLSTAHDVSLDRAEWAKAVADLPELAEPVQVRWQDFPRTATWKIRRVALREQLFTGARAIGIGRWT